MAAPTAEQPTPDAETASRGTRGKSDRTKTAYHVLRETNGPDGAKVYEPVTSNIEASSSEAAVRAWAENAPPETEGGVFVAVPARSFKPVKVGFEKTTVVRIA